MDDISAETSKKKGKIKEVHQQTSTMESLPPEVVQNILSRLSIISLLQAKLVCRLWHDLIRTPLFFSLHLSRMSENDPCLILHSDSPVKNQLYLVNKEIAAKIHVPKIPKFKVVGSCNGLLCLCDSNSKNIVYVYNPFTRKCTNLLKAEQFSVKEAVVFGFGFLPTKNEYKVVRIVYYRTEDGGNHPRRYFLRQSQVQIFTLGGCTWRNIGQVSYQLETKPSHALVNGRLHWLSCRDRSTNLLQVIVSFDLADEQFREVAGPNCSCSDTHQSHLVILRGCLALVIHYECFQREIWIMKEYNVKDSWMNTFSIGLDLPKDLDHGSREYYHFVSANRHLSNARVLCILKNGQILLECNREALLSYEPNSRTFKQSIFPSMPYLFESIVHISSLNWIDNIIG